MPTSQPADYENLVASVSTRNVDGAKALDYCVSIPGPTYDAPSSDEVVMPDNNGKVPSPRPTDGRIDVVPRLVKRRGTKQDDAKPDSTQAEVPTGASNVVPECQGSAGASSSFPNNNNAFKKLMDGRKDSPSGYRATVKIKA